MPANMVSTAWERAMMYKAAVQTVIIYGRESWVVTEATLKVMEGLHNWFAWRISEIPDSQIREGDWSGHR